MNIRFYRLFLLIGSITLYFSENLLGQVIPSQVFINTDTIRKELYSIRGKVCDASTGEALASANVRIFGTSRGAITNVMGEYSITLSPGSYIIVYSYIGYIPETVYVNLSNNTVRNVELRPSLIHIPEIVVIAEDPAIEIIRKAIANKRKWMNKLKSYQFDAFSRRVLWRDTSIAGIMESFTKGYYKTGDTLREIVIQRRQTRNIPEAENFAQVGRILNFNEDEIKLFSMNIQGNQSSYTFVGPTAPNALDYYDYKLLNTYFIDDLEIFQISVIPKSKLKPLFEGTITIADETFAVMGVDLKPNEAFTIPFLKDIELRYRQQFSLYDSLFWMPVDVRVKGNFSVSFVGISVPKICIDYVSSIYNYSINVEIPDSILGKPRLSVDSSAIVFDSTFWRTHEIIPLTAQEDSAYKKLDSAQTLAEQFKPSGALTFFGEGVSGSILKYLSFYFNRVEGFFLGGRYNSDSLTPITYINVFSGIGFSDKKIKYSFEGILYSSQKKALGVGVKLFDKINPIDNGGFYGPLITTFSALIDNIDYYDYWYNRGWQGIVRIKPSKEFMSEIRYNLEQHTSASVNRLYGIFSRNKSFRGNPQISEGKLRSLSMYTRLGVEPVGLDIIAQNFAEFSIEHSSKKFFKSDFEFTQYYTTFTWNLTTFSSDFLLPPSLRIRTAVGLSTGTVPVQRRFLVDTRLGSYAPFGVLRGGRVQEFTGDRFVFVSVEHNFRSLIFLLINIPYLYRNNIEIILHGSLAQSWNRSISTSNGWYKEVGIGISRVLDFLRFDVTYRIKEPKRFYFTMSIATVL